MPKLEEKELPISVFSTSNSVIEIEASELPNSMLPSVEDSLRRLAKSTGATLLESLKKGDAITVGDEK